MMTAERDELKGKVERYEHAFEMIEKVLRFMQANAQNLAFHYGP